MTAPTPEELRAIADIAARHGLAPETTPEAATDQRAAGPESTVLVADARTLAELEIARRAGRA